MTWSCWEGGHGTRGSRRGPWWFDPAFMAGPWAGAGRRRGGHWRGGRMFEQGDLKYVILRLLEEKPRHGYEIIKELEDRFGGAYSPSPGTVYPTLTMLEDLGYARARSEEGGRKIYEITDEGRAYLRDNRSAVDDIFERISEVGANLFGGAMMDVNAAVAALARSIYTGALWGGRPDPEKLRRIQDIVERARREIDALADTPRPQP